MLTHKEYDVRHCQEIPISSSTSCANSADSWNCKPFPYLSLPWTGDGNGTVLSCSIVDM